MRGSPWSAIAIAATVLVGGCGIGSPDPTPPPPPTEEAALSHLRRVVAVVEAGELDQLCQYGTGTCAGELRAVDRQSIPDEGPVVLGARVVPNRPAPGEGWYSGGVLLDLCGRDGTGVPYSSQMLVFYDGEGRLVSVNTLYWLGAGIAMTNEAVATARPVGACPGLDG